MELYAAAFLAFCWKGTIIGRICRFFRQISSFLNNGGHSGRQWARFVIGVNEVWMGEHAL